MVHVIILVFETISVLMICYEYIYNKLWYKLEITK